MARVSKTGESKVRFSKSEKITFFGFYTFFEFRPMMRDEQFCDFECKTFSRVLGILREFCRGWHKKIFDLSVFLHFFYKKVFRNRNENSVWFFKNTKKCSKTRKSAHSTEADTTRSSIHRILSFCDTIGIIFWIDLPISTTRSFGYIIETASEPLQMIDFQLLCASNHL